MDVKPRLLFEHPPEIKKGIARMARTEHYSAIVAWLSDLGILVTWNQVRYFISKSNIPTRLQTIPPVKGYNAKLDIYINALLEYNYPTFTINNIRLHGPSWSNVTKKLHEDGLIEPMRQYSPIRWRILATEDELREWYNTQQREV